MATARGIISGALTFRLNRLSPGETLDADVANVCLSGLNHILDGWNGAKSFLWREVLTDSTPITGKTATLGTDWLTVKPGDQIIGATVKYSGNLDVPLSIIDMGQYANIAIKSLSTVPYVIAYDGQSTVYVYPAAAGHVITLRTKQPADKFTDLDTAYFLPPGYESALSDMLAEVMAPTMLGNVPASVAQAAHAARRRIGAQSMTPAIIGGPTSSGRLGDFLRGF